MATTIKLKNSVTTTNAPSSLVQGEVAINITDKKVWVGNAATTPIQLLGDGGSASFTSIAFGAGTVSSPSITFIGDTNTGIYSPAADTIAFTEGGVESMRIDSSGNVGIGNTPSGTSATGYRSLELGTTAGTGITAGNGDFYIPVNAYVAGGAWKYATTSTASLLNIQGGLFTWSNAVSGTAGNNISFSERMRINSSGNVGIGTSSPAFPLDVRAATSVISAVSTTGTNSAYMYVSNTGGDFYLGRDNSAGSTFGTGTGYSAVLYSAGAYPMVFFTNATERMRIDANGNLLVGVSSAGMVNGGIQSQPSGNTTNVPFFGCAGNSSSSSYITYGLYSTSLSQYQFYVDYNGTISARSTSITGLSDISEKENIKPLETGLNEVLALQPRRFDWKKGSGQNIAGFVAQEVETVLPDLVADYKVDETTTKKGLKMGDMIPTLVKAIQEQQAMIEELKAKVTALENK